MNIVLFEDADVAKLHPITLSKPAMLITCGGSHLLEQMSQLGGSLHLLTQPHLIATLNADHTFLASCQSAASGESAIAGLFRNSCASQELRVPTTACCRDSIATSKNSSSVSSGNGSISFAAASQGVATKNEEAPWLFVNARLVPSVDARKKLKAWAKRGKPSMVQSGDALAAALVPAKMLLEAKTSKTNRRKDDSREDISSILKHLGLPRYDADLPLIEFPHDIIRCHPDALLGHLEERIATGNYQEVADGVFVAQGVRLPKQVVCDTSHGPILLEENVSVGPFTLLEGPVLVGANARILEHAAIKEFVTLGHTTKIGGEVEASIVEPYTNKQHHGFLGHSYLGSWINLGAGTCNSDLKNTYGKINMTYENQRVATEMQFVGVIMGDYAKTAINTSLFTGKTVGVCSMVYGFVTTNVPSFVNYARLFGQITATPVEVLVATQARMFARRNVEQRPCDIQLLHDMFELTRHERELGSVPLEPLSL